jgi:CelD/BcsL family acetyltransferase involved in cellulose biosynthesis
MESLRPAWDALYRTADYTIFQSFSWNHLAARAFPKNNLCIVYAEGQEGAALIPGVAEQGGLAFLGDAMFDYRDVLACGEPSALRQAWSQLAGLGLRFSLNGLRGVSRLPRWRMLGFEPQPFVSAPRARRADCTAEEFPARHVRSRRLLQRLISAGAELRRYSGAASALVRHIYERKAKQSLRSGENLFANSDRVDFMVALAALNPADCEIFTLESGACLVAALVCFRDSGVRRFYTIDYDRKWASYSPGVALVFEATRCSLAEGLDCDYMTGEQPHKMRFATSSEPLFRIEASCRDLHRIAKLPSAA